MNLTDKAIVAAARAWHDEIERSVVEPGDELVLWDYEDEDVKEHYLTTARANLEAAAPFIRAEVLRDEAERIHRNALGKPTNDEWFAQQWAMDYLARRASDMDPR